MQYEIVIKVITYQHYSDYLSDENVLSCLCETLSMANLVLGKKTSSSFLVFHLVCSPRSFGLFIPTTTANDLRLRRISIADFIHYILFLS